ncbi:MAG: hypothetical protein SOH80_04380 [Eubacteriales bacterium]|jgi:hypothetical protein
MKFRNKVLSVLLAAGMVASMPAATAFNVMADTTAEEALVGETDVTTDANWESPSWSWKNENGTYSATFSIKAKNDTEYNNVDYKKGEIYSTSTGITYSAPSTTATCTAAGTSTYKANITFNGVTYTSPDYTVQTDALGHDYNTENGTWYWTKAADGTWSVKYTVTCKRDSKHTYDYDATVTSFVSNPGTCTTSVTTTYTASVKIGDKTYYPKSAEAQYKKDANNNYVDKDGKVLKDQTKYTTEGVFTGYQSTGVSESVDADGQVTETAVLGHEYAEKSWNWDSEVTPKYTETKDGKTIDLYMDKTSENSAAYLANSDNDTDFKDHYKTNDIKLTVTCTSNNHYGIDGSKEAEVPAYVVTKHHPATCTADAYTTYTAYVFGSEDEAKAVSDEAATFYKDHQTYTINGQTFAYGSFKSVKTDTWEGTALGHTYYISGWTWSNDFSYVTLNLTCDRNYPSDNYITVQSSQITKNADGTATVVYTAKDQRKNDTTWYGSADKEDGYYWDQTRNPYGKTFTINALPLKNAGDVNNGKIVMTRLYNKTTGEHLYTSDANEIKTLVNEYNWTNEGTAWNAPAVSNTPVYRMFNRVTGEHVYTRDLNEVNTLSKKDEWNNEGIAWYSDDNKTVPVYRQFNPKAATSKASHNYTTSTNEKNTLTSQYGWNDEGIGWYGV